MDGVLVINKPQGFTSHDVVARVRRIVGERSVGHLGTLDPMATGVLPLVLGRFTRLAQFYTASEKAYAGTIRFGFATDTYDADGDRVGDALEVEVSVEQVREAADGFVGHIQQVPPPFSAKKLAGVPAYKLARKEKPVELKAVEVEVRRLEVTSCIGDLCDFEAEVSSGTYIRSIAHELGQKLGIGGHLASLVRTRSAEFTLNEAITLEELQAATDNGDLERVFIHPRKLLPQIPSATATDEVAGYISHGRAVNLPVFTPARHVKIFHGADRLLAVATRVAGTLFQPKVVLTGG